MVFFFLNLLELEKIKDRNSEDDLYSIALNLPHQSNKQEFEMQYKLLLKNIEGNTKDYFKALYAKKEQWCRAFKKEDSLETYSTGIIENVNKLLKEHVTSQCSLNEYLYRMLKFTSDFNNKDGLPAEELLQYNSYYTHIGSSAFLIQVKEKITDFALVRTVISMIRSFSWVTTGKPLELCRADDKQKKIVLDERNGIFHCCCGFFSALKIPCEHILRFLSEKKKEADVMNYYSPRWSNKLKLSKDDALLEYLESLIEGEESYISDNETSQNSQSFHSEMSQSFHSGISQDSIVSEM